MKKPIAAPALREDDDDHKSGIRAAIDDTVTDVKESIGRVTNDPRYGKDGTDPGQPSSAYATSTDSPAPMADGVGKLQECLRGELSAVEAYQLAIESVKDVELNRALRQLRESHDRRVVLLRDRLRQDGAKPEEGSGAWGAFAKIVQMGADLLGSSTAMSALEEGEDHGLKLYSADLGDCDMSTREFIVVELLPEQQRSHDLCRTLDRFVKVT